MQPRAAHSRQPDQGVLERSPVDPEQVGGEHRERVVAELTPSQMCSARWLTQYTAPRGVGSTFPAPQISWRVTRKGMSTSASRENSPCRVTR